MGSAKEARKEVCKLKNFDGCLDYVKTVVYPLLDKQNNGGQG
jgi:hypothetical protein